MIWSASAATTQNTSVLLALFWEYTKITNEQHRNAGALSPYCFAPVSIVLSADMAQARLVVYFAIFAFSWCSAGPQSAVLLRVHLRFRSSSPRVIYFLLLLPVRVARPFNHQDAATGTHELVSHSHQKIKAWAPKIHQKWVKKVGLRQDRTADLRIMRPSL